MTATVPGRRIVAACPRCRCSTQPHWRFCDQCGLRLADASPSVPALDAPTTPVAISGGAAAPPAEAPAHPGAFALTLSAFGLLFRLVNGILTVVSGIAIAVVTSHDANFADHRGLLVAGGIAWALYGGYILLTRRSYWVSSLFTYLVPVVVIAYECGAFEHLR